MTYIYDLFFWSAVQLLPINVNVPRSWKSLKTKLSPWRMFKNYVWQQTVITELCTKDGSVSIKTRNPQILVTETYKVRNYLAPTIVKDLLVKTQNFYYLRNNSQFSRPVIKSAYYSTESISTLRLPIWDRVSSSIKEINQWETFKKVLKK